MTNGIKGAAVAAVLAAGGLVSNAFGLASLPFIEEFASGNANWLNEPGASATWMPTGGADGGGYISYTPPAFTSNSSGAFSAPPFQLMFRANNSTSSSGGAFVGNWLSGGVASLNLAVRHNYETSLNFYARLAGVGGAGASLAFDASFAVAPNAWTSVSIPIVNSNPPFLSYGSGSFNGIFSNILNMQFGLYLPASTAFTALQMDLDNVSIVPEPGTVGLVVIGLAGLGILRRRQSMRSKK
jgi:hypothetical protein